MKKTFWKSFFSAALILIGAISFAQAEDNVLSDAEKADGFELIFNGKNLDGWRGDTKGYLVEDGIIVCKPGGNLYLPKDYKNFVIRFDFRGDLFDFFLDLGLIELHGAILLSDIW